MTEQLFPDPKTPAISQRSSEEAPSLSQERSSLPAPILLSGQRDRVFALAWSANGSWLASGGRDHEVLLWNTTDFSCHARYVETRAVVLSLAWSPDSSLLAIGATDGSVHIWEPESGRQIQCYRGHKRFVRALAWSPDGSWLASGGDFGDSTIQVWNVRSGRILCSYIDQERIFALDWSPVTGRLLAVSFDGQIVIRRPGPGKAEVLTCPGKRGPLYSARWSPAGELLAAGGEDCLVQLWQPGDVRPRLIFSEHSAPLKSLVWSPAGGQIASAGEDCTIRIWQAATGTIDQQWSSHASWIRALAFAPDGRFLASTSDAQIQLQPL